jgi:hypothetical protein
MTLEVDGIPQASTDAKYYASGWKTFGTGITETSMELLPNNYPFKVYFDGTSEQQSQDIGINPVVAFSITSPILKSATIIQEDQTSMFPEYSIHVYPNPAKDYINVVVSGKEEQTIQLKIYNSTGQLIYISSGKGMINEEISLKDNKSGLYSVIAIVDSKLIIQKVLVE